MIVELEINGARIIVTGENLTVNVSEDGQSYHVDDPSIFITGMSVGIDALREWLSESRGRLTALSKYLGVKHPSILQWKDVPADRLIAVNTFTGIDRRILRPDLFEGLGD
ncbi:hypothetical protein [Brucella intermedia]|uniref:hypothetical protein n=1 Tax=Brucella intermedia TaxID=94625 RepID=UPI0004698918|nr:hypothetical protein [Brucella intermedia]